MKKKCIQKRAYYHLTRKGIWAGLCGAVLFSAITFAGGIMVGSRMLTSDIEPGIHAEDTAATPRSNIKKNQTRVTITPPVNHGKHNNETRAVKKDPGTTQGRVNGPGGNDPPPEKKTGAKKSAAKTPSMRPKSAKRDGEHRTASKIYIRVASFKNTRAAVLMSNKLQKEGYPAYTRTEKNAGKSTWHVVMIGPFDGSTKAERILNSVKKLEKTAFIVKKG